MKLAIISAVLTLLHINMYAQCNGYQSLCGKTYNEVAYLTTHNAFNTDADGFSLPNQNNSLTTQLNDGVRGFMLDVYSYFGTPTVYHGTFVLGTAPLSDNLAEFKNFLDANPNEVVTIILECNVDADDIEEEINDAGLSPYLYTHNGTWPTLQTMIDNNTRLVIFSDVDDASTSQGWYHYMWDNMVETHYSFSDINDFNCDYNRGDSLNDLFIFNHFITNSITGTGQEGESQTANSNPFLIDRILQCQSEKGKFPNFITLDFYELGDGLTATNTINGIDPMGVMDLESDVQVYPNPFTDLIQLSHKGLSVSDVQLFDSKGVNVMANVTLVLAKDVLTLETNALPTGIYLLQIGTQMVKLTKL
jgi:hypothetical protein